MHKRGLTLHWRTFSDMQGRHCVIGSMLLGSVTVVQEMQEFQHTLIASGSKSADVERFLCDAYNSNLSL